MLSQKYKKIKRIVVTGGPCAGKTKIIPIIKKHLQRQGFAVYVLSEVPTMFGNMGFKLGQNNMAQTIQYQMIRVQIELENNVNYLARLDSNERVCIIYDRGLLDYKVYSTVQTWKNALSSKGLDANMMTKHFLYKMYDHVLFLNSLACYSEYQYDLCRSGNQARFENADMAVTNNEKTKQMWQEHPNFMFFDNSETFELKVSKILKTIDEINKKEDNKWVTKM